MMVFPSLLPSSILFCKGMDLGVLESCIRGMLLLIDYCHDIYSANIYCLINCSVIVNVFLYVNLKKDLFKSVVKKC